MKSYPIAMNRVAMQALHESQLENVSDAAYPLKDGFTPNYCTTTIERDSHAGCQLRVQSTLIAVEGLGFSATDEAVRAATRRALRVLMVGMRDEAAKWLKEHPETDNA